MDRARRKRILIDLGIIAVSIFAAGFLVQSNLVQSIVTANASLYMLSAFVAGLFFTSVFTTAPAMVALGSLCAIYPPITVAVFGALGALIGDYVIFSFIRGHISEDITYLLSQAKSKRMKHVFHHRFMRWSMAIVGAIIIASPLPDELGLTLMGLSKMSTVKFAAISYTFNFIGIVAIGFVARAF
ncbi:MAG TPA: hypothetical protein VGE35_00480 [Candidatus Paceibacterota bacterium]